MTKVRTLRIGAIDFEVVFDEMLGANGAVGELDYDRCRIRLQSGLPAQREQLVLWHETIHAILLAGGYHEHDEKLIEILSQGIVMALRDNGDALK